VAVISIKPGFFDPFLLFMGSGTLVDGVRRWFQRRITSSSSSSSSSSSNLGRNSDSNLNYPYNNKLDYVDNGENGNQLLSSDLRAQSTILPPKRKRLRKQPHPGGEGILERLSEEEDDDVDDLDYSALKLIKVPKRTNHFRAPPPPPPLPAIMDSHKKVFLAASFFSSWRSVFALILLSLSLFLCFYMKLLQIMNGFDFPRSFSCLIFMFCWYVHFVIGDS